MVEESWSASASDIVGKSNTDRELVMVEGKLIKDIAMPVSTPNILSASSLDKPERISIIGIKIASILLRILTSSLLNVRGTVNLRNLRIE